MLSDDEGMATPTLRIATYLGKPGPDPETPDEVPPDRVQLFRHERGALVVDGEPVDIADELEGIVRVGGMLMVTPLVGRPTSPKVPSWYVVSVECPGEAT